MFIGTTSVPGRSSVEHSAPEHEHSHWSAQQENPIHTRKIEEKECGHPSLDRLPLELVEFVAARIQLVKMHKALFVVLACQGILKVVRRGPVF